MAEKNASPLALFDSLECIDTCEPPTALSHPLDFEKSIAFIKCYKGSLGTFNAYRREVERLLQWSWHIAGKSITQLKREDIEAFLHFCQNPPTHWIGTKKVPRFIMRDGLRQSNPEWRPFVVTISKAAHRKGSKPSIADFELSQGTLKEVFAILSTYFQFLLQEEYIFANPVALIRQKSKFIRRQQSLPKIRRLTEHQWQTVIEAAHQMASKNPEQHERTLFIFSALYGMYLRISELVSSDRWTPRMNDFHRDHDGNWWFLTVGKGNKERKIAVSDAMLTALKRWRSFLNLSPLPTPADNSPILPKHVGKGPITSTTYVREIVQTCFDRAIETLRQQNQVEEAEALVEATVHWLRHTGISDDVKRRPREHVRDDAGHSSSAVTDRYIDVALQERHRSARDKPITTPED